MRLSGGTLSNTLSGMLVSAYLHLFLSVRQPTLLLMPPYGYVPQILFVIAASLEENHAHHPNESVESAMHGERDI